MKLWIARNTDDTLVLFQNKPIMNVNLDWEDVYNEDCMFIPDDLYPQVTWVNSPQLIEIKLAKGE